MEHQAAVDGRLIERYLLDELSPDETAEFEAHFFECALCADDVCQGAHLAANLKAQGWKNDGSDMVNPQSSILKRKQGEATLTIFVKPANGGSEVKMMTEGLSWE